MSLYLRIIKLEKHKKTHYYPGKMKKKTALVIILLIIFISFSFGQTTSDPNDELYRDIDVWENKGYISKLPLVRPYPAQYIIKLLEKVAATGSEKDAGKAREYLENLQQFSVSAGATHTSRITLDDYAGETGVNAQIEGMPAPLLSVSADINVFLVDQQAEDALPAYTRPEVDLLPDWSDVDILGKNYQVRQGLNSSAAVGTDELWFQTGLIRSSFGPFTDDGAVISPKAPQAGHFSLTWMQEAFSYNSTLLALTATTDEGDDSFPEKYLAMHTITFYPFSWLELSAFESVVYGGRFEPLYLMPFSEFFYLQGTIGFPDNSLIGFTTSAALPYNIDFDFLLYADDLHFNDMIRFDFDTKYKLSFQTGLSWAPPTDELRQVSLDYLLVTPYMYTHKDTTYQDDANYQNYTHQGENLGPTLDPNSDRLSLSVLLKPLDFLNVELTCRYIRHGNGSVDGSENVGGGDGSIFDDGFIGDICTFQDTTRFMVQDIIEHTLQAGITADAAVKLGEFKLGGSAGYTLEWIKNKDLVVGTEWNHYFDIGLSLAY